MAVGTGLFISIEGGEGCGKTVQSRALVASLERRGAAVQLVREPGGTPLAERIREVLLFAKEVPLSPEAQALLFSAARAQLTREVIRPALERGAYVVADRYFDSTLAYQGYGLGMDVDALRAVTRFAVGNLVPDVTFLLDLPAEVGLRRTRQRSERWDRFEADDEAFHKRVRAGYLDLARQEPKRYVVVDATRPEGDVAAEVVRHVDEVLRHRSRIAAHP